MGMAPSRVFGVVDFEGGPFLQAKMSIGMNPLEVWEIAMLRLLQKLVAAGASLFLLPCLVNMGHINKKGRGRVGGGKKIPGNEARSASSKTCARRDLRAWLRIGVAAKGVGSKGCHPLRCCGSVIFCLEPHI